MGRITGIVFFLVVTAFIVMMLGMPGGNQPGTAGLKNHALPVEPLMPEIGAYKVHVYSDDITGERAYIDLSNTGKGIIAVKCETDRDARLALQKGEIKQTEIIPAVKDYTAYPLEMGNGVYTAEIFLCVGDDQYESVLRTAFEVKILQENYRFMIPNHVVSYRGDSAVVELARTLRAGAETEAELISGALDWIGSNIEYDQSLIPEDGKGYLPDLNRILTEKTGICPDYASLFAALMRINRIPCKVVYGYLDRSGEKVYHAWNMVLAQSAHDHKEWVLCDPTWYSNSSVLDAAPAENTYSDIQKIY